MLNQTSGDPLMLIHAGNNQGDVFIYQVDFGSKQEIDLETGAIK